MGGNIISYLNDKEDLPRLYHDLAEWFYLLTPPEDYADEAAFYRETIVNCNRRPVRRILELGSGGGNNASYLKHHFRMTLVDISKSMLKISRRLNPECEHIAGDMRRVRLNRQFDAVFIHDAIGYMTTEEDLVRVIETAFVHCLPGGVALFMPDYTRETYQPSASHGGKDEGNRGLRYLEWVWDPDPDDSTYIVEMVYLMRDGKNVTCQRDRHVMGLFSNDKWLQIINDAGFNARIAEFKADCHTNMGTHIFLGIKPE